MEGPLGWGRQEVDGWRKGPWTSQEDRLLVEHVRQHGEGRWNSVSKLTGLKRSGKSCRLRACTEHEINKVLVLDVLKFFATCMIMSRWSTIARSLPGRTDNEIKNYWRTHFKKGKPSKNIERARARFLKQRQEMQQSQKQQQQLLQMGQVVVAKDENEEDGGARAGTDDDDRGSAVVDDACAAAPAVVAADEASGGHRHEDLIMQDDAMMDFMCPMSCALLLHGAGVGQGGAAGSCCGSTASEEYGSSEEDGATWGSLWNLEGVVDDDGAGACTLW
ncbi:hypothetical protein HU200_032483 [Digitaria exilis]|uniref:Uncharacterized protein n=1 Tax=Digitaria exilis TaxID=1010633 RepID=A0A835BNC3_9POAL|nr:hypothetical protein HU200_032483 [Digitaria exilis]